MIEKQNSALKFSFKIAGNHGLMNLLLKKGESGDYKRCSIVFFSLSPPMMTPPIAFFRRRMLHTSLSLPHFCVNIRKLFVEKENLGGGLFFLFEEYILGFF